MAIEVALDDVGDLLLLDVADPADPVEGDGEEDEVSLDEDDDVGDESDDENVD